jgi:hypothetical protein
VPTHMVIEITPEEQARLLAELRRARRGHGLALHILLLLTLPGSPREIAAVWLCARFTVYAVARIGKEDDAGRSRCARAGRPVSPRRCSAVCWLCCRKRPPPWRVPPARGAAPVRPVSCMRGLGSYGWDCFSTGIGSFDPKGLGGARTWPSRRRSSSR